MNPTEDHSNDIALAGEYALHLLGAEDRRAFEERMKDEPDLRQLLMEWDQHLAEMSDDFAPVVPPAHIMARIEERLFPASQERPAARWGWLRALGLAGAVAVLAFIALPFFDTEPPAPPAFTAQVVAEDASLVVVANYFPQTGTLQIDRQVGAAAEGRTLELWLIADGAAAPVSIGLLSANDVTEIRVPAALAAQIAGGTFAISDEAPGGSPTGAPTGNVLAVGQVSEF
jgi:anti-sigma-K factor RskA